VTLIPNQLQPYRPRAQNVRSGCGQPRQATDFTRRKPGILLASSWGVTIQIGDGPPQEASLRLLADASSWAIDIGTGTTLFPHRTRKLHLRVLDASALEEALLRFLDIEVPPLWGRRPADC